MRCPLDHFVVAVPDVRAASRAVADALGIEPAFGGAHPDHGTCNALLSLGEGRYLELIGPDPHATSPGDLARRAAAVDGAEVWGFAVAQPELETLAEMAPSLQLQATARLAGGGDDDGDRGHDRAALYAQGRKACVRYFFLYEQGGPRAIRACVNRPS